MSLRCLLFTSDEGVIRPIQQALAELGMEAKNCPDAGDALIQVKTADFQIVIADWNCPETVQLIAAAKDRSSRERPLILAVVSDAADTKSALRAGANSTLRRPLESGQILDTLDMARDLLRAKESAKAAAASGGDGAAQAFAPPVHDPDMHLRAGEFLANARSTPGAQFQVEADAPILSDHAEVEEPVKPLIELEPMASEVGVEDITAQSENMSASVMPVRAPEPEVAAPKAVKEKPRSLEELLQSRRQSQPVVAAKPASGELLNFGDMIETAPAVGGGNSATDQSARAANANDQQQAASEAALFSYITGGEEPKADEGAEPRRWVRPAIFAAALAMVVAMAAVKVSSPQWSANLALIYGMGHDLLNPPVAKPAEVPRGHEDFGRAGDEYRLPAADPIPDATTDPAEITVVPVVDPTLKTNSSPPAGSAADPNVAAPAPVGTDSADATKTVTTPVSPATAPPIVAANDTKPAAGTPKRVEPDTVLAAKSAASAATLSASNTSATQPAQQGIPKSLQSQIAPSDPAPGGVKPMEAALPSIEPVNLPESDARALLLEVVPPSYPKTVALNAQRGSVVVAVTLGRDGSVQDAKFLQGSLSFARSAIEAVRQWRFKPYLMNGRAVAVQTVMTLTFSPPA